MSSQHYNYIPDYPDQKYTDIQWDISRRIEFMKFADKENEKKNLLIKDNFFDHQVIVEMIMRVYDRLMVIHETGTGKTGTVINIVDYNIINKTNMKKVYVLEPGPPTKEDFKKQILKLSRLKDTKFDNNKYYENENIRKYNISNNIRKYYNIETYQIFTTQIEKKAMTEEEIIEEFSDCYFFLDEIHRLRNQNQGDSGIDGNPENIYNILWKIFHLAKRIKVVLLTATPMVNSVSDFVPLINLILPADKQLPTSWNYDYVNIRQLESYLRGYISYIKSIDLGVKRREIGDYINYIHKIKFSKDRTEISPTVKKIENNKIITVIPDMLQENSTVFEEDIKSTIKIYQLEMIELQKKIYLKILEENKIKNFRLDEKQISVAVFPDGSYGEKGFKKNIRLIDDEFKFTPHFFSNFDIYDKIEELDEQGNILSYIKRKKDNVILLEQIKNLSCKYYDFFKRELSLENKGCSFIYLESVRGTGLIYFGLLLQLLGYELFDKPSVFKRVKNSKGEFEKQLIDFPKKKRYSLITSYSKNSESILELMNSKQNVDGDYIQIIAVSRLARDGINIFNIRKGYLFGSDWHEAGMHQALSRFYRADSYENIKEKYPNDEIYIDIYRMASTLNNRDMSVIEKLKKEISSYDEFKEDKLDEDDFESKEYLRSIESQNIKIKLTSTVDIDMYLLAEEKDIYEKRKINIMKCIAIDAFINYSKNINIDAENYSKETDYSEKFYRIWGARGLPNNDKRQGIALNQGPNKDDINYTTYKLFYYEESIKEYLNDFLLYLSLKGSINIFQFIYHLKKENNTNPNIDFIYNGFDYLQNNKKYFIYDDFGKKKFINLIGNSVFLTDMSTNLKNDLVYGNSYPYFIKNKKIENENEEDLIDYDDIIENLNNMNKKDILEYLKNKELNNINRMNILEKTMIKHIKDSSDNKYLNILSYYDYYIYVFDPQEELINYTKDRIKETNLGLKGKPRQENSYAGIKNIFNTYDELSIDKNIDITYDYNHLNKDKIILHIYEEKEQKNSYNVTSYFTRKDKHIRILRFKDDDYYFENVRIDEKSVYNWLIIKSYENRINHYGNELYGMIIYSRDDNFRLYNFNEQTKGITCESIKYELLEEILYRFAIENIKKKDIEVVKDVEKILKKEYNIEDEILKMYNKKELSIILKIRKEIDNKKLNKKNLCDYLFKLFKKYEKLIEII